MNWIKNIFKCNNEPIPTNYGHGFEAKQLMNSKWVLMYRGEACDLKCYGCKWEPHHRFYKDCIGTRKEIDNKAKDIMSRYGCFK